MKKNKFFKILCSILVFSAVFAACKKESDNIFTLFKDVAVNYNKAIGQDEVYIEFKITKPSTGAMMSKVIVTETGNTTPLKTIEIPYTNRFTYESGVLIVKTSNPGNPAYTITVLDEADNDITAQVTTTYPTGNLITQDPVLVTDGDVVTFEEGTTVYLDYTITSENKDINSVTLESFATGSSEPARVTVARVPVNSDKRSYRGAVRLLMDRNGMSKFRIIAMNAADEFMGDGAKYVNTNVNAGYELVSNKFIYFPNTDATTANPDITSACFYSISKKKAYNYTEAKEHSADIDFGIYMVRNVSNPNVYTVNLYSINDVVAGNPMMDGRYDFSTWTKRATMFTVGLPTNAATIFNTTMVSGRAIQVQAKTFEILMTRRRVNNIQMGTIMYFRTPEGKYGAVFFNATGRDYMDRMYLNIDVKIEK